MRMILAAFLVVLGLLVFSAAYHSTYRPEALFFIEQQSRASLSAARLSTGIAGMLMGILFGGLYNRLEKGQRVSNALAVVPEYLKSADFMAAMLVSPIVFSSVYVGTRQQPDYVIAFIFAFQNGFFWDQVFAAALRRFSRPDAASDNPDTSNAPASE